MMPIIANRVSKLGVTDIKLNLTSILRMKTMIDFYYCNVVKVEIRDFSSNWYVSSLIELVCLPH